MKDIVTLKKDYAATLWNVEHLLGGYAGMIKLQDCGTCSVVWGYNEDGYEHVSVSPMKKYRMPSWDDMARLKDVFFDPEEEVYQIMPKHSEYVNLMGNCLHLWRPSNGKRLDDAARIKG